ncbi:ABC transporter substrate-binding protein [Subtercola vilae]|uniref:Extracellular solute-binding protein n=1 Tax=Subtercola vilae TaxID=2056433 RepID=A0A4T2BZL9_9MICO|nr:extracellular solute-binding protein [Subtercola vilae]TIH36612.1 extracellular solute-binding protein [Subtercola vilae]
MNFSRKRPATRLRLVIALGVTTGLAVTGCASASDSSSGGAATSAATSAAGTLPSALVDAAVAAAKTASGGIQFGGEINILGVTSGDEAKALTDAMAPFTTATGTKINYTGSQDWSTVLATGIASNNVPDIVDAQGAGTALTYAKQGLFLPLNSILGDTLKANYSQGLLDAVTVNGDTYGIWGETDAFMVWYNTKTYTGPTKPASYDELNTWATTQAATGVAPWCMALEAGPGSGFRAESWVENMFLKMYGPEKLAAWANGTLPFNSPEVKAAFQRYADVAGSKTMVNGGPQTVVSTSFLNYTTGMFSSPQQCQLSLWGNYAVGLTTSTYPNVQVPGDMNFFTVPGATPAADTAQNTAGHVLSALKSKDSPTVEAFMKYWASSDAQSLIAASGRWSVGNKNVALASYPNATMKASADLLNNASTIVIGPTGTMPTAVVAAWDKANIAIAQDPSTLDAQLDAIQALVPAN